MSIGMLQYDIIAGFFGTQSSIFSRLIYILFGVAALWIVVMAIRGKGRIHVFKNKPEKKEEREENYNRERNYEGVRNDN